MFKLLMISRLLLEICRGIWAIEPNAAQAYYPVVRELLKGNTQQIAALMPKAADWGAVKQEIETQKREFQVMTLKMEAGAFAPSRFYGFDKAPKGSVSLIPLHSAVTKYDYCGDPGTTTLSQWLQEADANSNIVAHILSIDSPGGEVSGTQDFANLILQVNKPVVAFCHGMMCSAAYWIGSSAKHIMISNDTAIVGSIGTYITLADYTKQLEQDGITLHEIYATRSTDKNLLYKEAVAGNYDPIRNEMLDPINEQFLSAVKKNRFGKKLDTKETLTGKTFLGSKAIDLGLVDSKGNLADAVKLATKLAA